MLPAVVIAILWITSFLSVLSFNLQSTPILFVLIAIFFRTFLQTGLFIIAHDAMHSVLCRSNLKLNATLGSISLALYAFLPFSNCSKNHNLHHKYQATELDPDFSSANNKGILSWYLKFMTGYLSLTQMGMLLCSWGLLWFAFKNVTPSAMLNVFIFCIVPLLLSSMQLFIFGTYLPHRHQGAGEAKQQAQSLELPALLSLLACYHFGYHREHHINPSLAWFELPAARCRSKELAISGELN
jgi:beta-carotene ketolase (CrtW type)